MSAAIEAVERAGRRADALALYAEGQERGVYPRVVAAGAAGGAGGASSIDLHELTTAVAIVAVVHTLEGFAAGGGAGAGAASHPFAIITGRGKHNDDGEGPRSSLKPAIKAALAAEYAHLRAAEDATNPGRILIPSESLREIDMISPSSSARGRAGPE